MIISGLGLGKNYFEDAFKQLKQPVSLIPYSTIENLQSEEVVLLVYDGLCLDELEGKSDKISGLKYIPIFITPNYIYVFGINISSDIKKEYCCPKCVIKRSKQNVFTLKLYETLFKRVDYKTIPNNFGYEIVHFCNILLNSINENNLSGALLSYNMLNNLYSLDKFSGTTGCKYCDSFMYDQKTLYASMKEVLIND